MAHDAHNLATPRLQWMGVFPADVEQFGIPARCCLPLSKRGILLLSILTVSTNLSGRRIKKRVYNSYHSISQSFITSAVSFHLPPRSFAYRHVKRGGHVATGTLEVLGTFLVVSLSLPRQMFMNAALFDDHHVVSGVVLFNKSVFVYTTVQPTYARNVGPWMEGRD